MAFQRTRDILEHAKSFHEQLSAFYGRLSDTAAKDRIKVLLNYMSRHEQHLVEALSGLESDAARKVLDTWFKFGPEMPACTCFECMDLQPDMTLEQITQAALKVDRCLVDFYRQAVEKAVSQDVKDLFTRLLEMEQKEETECLKNALWYAQEA